MADLNALVVFAKVVEASSFSEAARRLKMPISTVSRRVAELEEQMGVRLLERSTRVLRLTELGADVLEMAVRGAELSDAIDSIVSNRRSDVVGTLRLSAPPSISDTLLSPMITAFQEQYPGVRFQILVTDRMIDHISEGVDLVFRRGTLKESSLIARRLLTYRHRLVAAPKYLDGRPLPQKPQDLLEHRLLSFSHWQRDSRWTFVHRNRKEAEPLIFIPYLAMNDFAGILPAMLAGGGIGELPPIVQPDLFRSGQLVEVMPDWRLRTFDLSLVHVSNRHISKPCRLFKEFAADMAPVLFPDLPI
jgi:DNA-binding transcriptional LysR family regulator